MSKHEEGCTTMSRSATFYQAALEKTPLALKSLSLSIKLPSVIRGR
jgi:hypothetical protein